MVSLGFQGRPGGAGSTGNTNRRRGVGWIVCGETWICIIIIIIITKYNYKETNLHTLYVMDLNNCDSNCARIMVVIIIIIIKIKKPGKSVPLISLRLFWKKWQDISIGFVIWLSGLTVWVENWIWNFCRFKITTSWSWWPGGFNPVEKY